MRKKNLIILSTAVFICAAVAVLLISITNAATNPKKIESENAGDVRNISLVNNPSASGDKYIEFNADWAVGGILDRITGTTYYVDCNGDDASSGTSVGQAWKTLAKASQASLSPGDGIALKRNCIFEDPRDRLEVSSSGTESNPVIVTAYGEGSKPHIISSWWNGAVRITASHVIVDNISVEGEAKRYTTGPDCTGTKNDYILGFYLETGSEHNVIQYSEATGFYAGILIFYNSNHNKVMHNRIHNNDSMEPNDWVYEDDAGAFAILINGNNNEVAYNHISNHQVCSVEYGTDGAAVEIYDGSNNTIHHNRAVNNNAFVELGNDPNTADVPDGNTLAFNVVSATNHRKSFVVTRGAEKTGTIPERNIFGPVRNTLVINNSVYYTGDDGSDNSDSKKLNDIILCSYGCDDGILEVRNNILQTGWRAVYSEHPFDRSSNLWWREDGKPELHFRYSGWIDETSKIIDPGFVDPDNGDLRLKADSPARGNGTAIQKALEFGTDFEGNPLSLPLDIGAYQGD